MKMYLVGGAVRDKMMGKTPKDFDYTVVLTQEDLLQLDLMNNNIRPGAKVGPVIDPFTFMGHKLRQRGFRVFLQTPEFATIRARLPKTDKRNQTADFVLARKEGEYTDGRRPDSVSVGTLMDDLQRRDFTMNAIAEDMDTGEIADPFNGRLDISQGRIKAVGNAKDRMMEDSLRVLRALRFKIQLGFVLDESVEDMLFDNQVLGALINVSDERKMDELNKMFKADSLATIRELNHYHLLGSIVLGGKVKLMAHMKEKF